LSRRVRLPDADDLFRPTVAPDVEPTEPPTERAAERATDSPEAAAAAGTAARSTPRQASGRVKHDEKMTVYVTADELLEIENARLALRRHHGLVVDRGRIVREAVALVLADLDRLGEESPLVRRLGGE
jgi:hypothetical protein